MTYDVKETNIKLSVVATKAANSSIRVEFPEYVIPVMNGWDRIDIEMVVESTTNLCADTGTINVSIGASGVESTNLFVNSGSYVDFIAADTNASGNVQPCSVYYIP